MKRKSILLVLCIGMILTSCESKISLNSTDVKNEKNQKNTTMENLDKGYNLPIDEDKKKEVVNDCEEIMGIIRDIYSEYNGIQEADQNTACKCQYKNAQKVENKNVHFPRTIPQPVFP